MIAVLEAPEIRKQARPLSVEAYHRLGELGEIDESVELIEGVLCNKMSKSSLHTTVVKRLFKALLKFCDLERFEVIKEDPLTLENSEPEPDIAVVEGQDEDFEDSHPTSASFVVEVAITSVVIDQLKANSYARAGIPEYWLIRPAEGEIDVYLDPSDEGYKSIKTISTDQQLPSVALPGFSIKLADLLPKQKS